MKVKYKIMLIIFIIYLALQGCNSFITTQKYKNKQVFEGIEGNCTSIFEDDDIFSECSIQNNPSCIYLDGETAEIQLQQAFDKIQFYDNKMENLQIDLQSCPSIKKISNIKLEHKFYQSLKNIKVKLDLENLVSFDSISNIIVQAQQLTNLEFYINMDKVKFTKIDQIQGKLQRLVLNISNSNSNTSQNFEQLFRNQENLETLIIKLQNVKDSENLLNSKKLNFKTQQLRKFDFSLKDSNIQELNILRNADEMLNLQKLRITLNNLNNTNKQQTIDYNIILNFLLPIADKQLQVFKLEDKNYQINTIPLNNFISKCQKLDKIDIKLVSKGTNFQKQRNLNENKEIFYFTENSIILEKVESKKPSFCKTASGLKTNCTSCHKDKFLDITTNHCITKSQCQQKQRQGFIFKNDKCECQNGYVLKEGKCVKQCGMIQGNQYVNDKNVCNKCQVQGCQICQDDSPYICLMCDKDKIILDNQACVTKCPQGFVVNKDVRGDVFCVAKCPENKFSFKKQCYQTCPNGYFENYELNSCEKCDSSCNTCQNDSKYCTSCSDSLLLFNQCTDQCPEFHFYLNKNFQECQQCDNMCLKCENSNTCLLCAEGLYMTSKNICQSQCPLKTTIINPKNMTCDDCSQNCKTCQHTVDTCTSCWGNSVLDKITQKCVSTCNNGLVPYFELKICVSQTCEMNCDLCDSQKTKYCYQCQSGYLLQNNKCIKQCYNNEIMINNVCCSENNFIVYGGQCTNSCPLGTFEIFEKSTCQACQSGCVQCNDTLTCDKCDDGYYWIDNSCNRMLLNE